MLGNSLNYLGFTPQQKIFDLKNYNLQNITNISLFFYQEKGSFLDNQGNLIPYKDSFNNNLPSNIFIDNINLSFGFFIDELTVGADLVTIYPAEGYVLSYDVEPQSAIVELNWLHWNETNERILTKEEISKDSRYHIEWYQYQLYDDAIQTIKIQREQKSGEFAGIESEDRLDLIEAGLIENLGCTHIKNNNWQRLYEYDDCFSCEVVLDGDASTQEQVRAFVYYSDSTTVFESNILTFEGENESNPKVTTKKQGIYLTVEDETNGEYYLYTETQVLKHEDKKTRILTVQYYTADGEEVDLLNDTNYVIEWTGPDPEKASMLVNCQPGSKRTEYIYNIASQYNPSALENTISCKITYNDGGLSYNNYIAEQTFNFGYANVANTDQQLLISFQNGIVQNNNVYCSKNALQLNGSEPESFILKNFDIIGKENDDSAIEIDWYLVSYPVSTTGEKTIIELNELEANTELPNKTTDLQLVCYANQKDVVYLIPPESGFNYDTYLILCAIAAGSKVEFPLPVSADQYEYNYITGATYVLYRQLGLPIYNKEPYCIYDHNGNELEGEFSWIYTGDDWYEIENNCLIPSQVYLETHGPVGVQCKKNETIVWSQPITISESAFSSTTLSAWDGKSVQINDNSVTSPMIMAGKKEEDDFHDTQFTGVMIGDLQADTNGAIPLTGLYGFKKGNPSFGFKEDGTAFIGEAGLGRILFEGNKGWITSGDLIERTVNNLTFYKATSFIDLTAQGVPFQVYNTYTSSTQTQIPVESESEEEEEIEEIEEETGVNNIILESKNLIAKFGDNFFISSNGDVSIKGNLIATRLIAIKAGQIASFQFDSNWLYSSNYNAGLNRNLSVVIGSTGIFLGSDLTKEGGADLMEDSPFWVTSDGSFKAVQGTIGGWNVSTRGLTARDGEYSYNLKSSSDGSNVMASFGDNCFILDDGTGVFENAYLAGDINIAGSVKGIYRIVSVSKKYTIPKNNYVKTLSGTVNVGDYVAVAIAGIVSGHKKAKIVRFTVTKGGSWTVMVSKEPYKGAKISPTLTLKILLLKSDDVADINYINNNDEYAGDNDPTNTEDNIYLNEESSGGSGIITIPAFGENSSWSTGSINIEDNSAISSTADIDDNQTPAFVTGNNSANLTGVAYLNQQETFTQDSIHGTNTTYAFGTAANPVKLYYNNLEVATTSYVGNIFGDSGTGATKNWVKGRFYSTNSSDSHYLDISLYAKITSPTFKGVPKAPTPTPSDDNDPPGHINTTQIATCNWVYNNYCETTGNTITAIKNKINAIIDAADLNVSKFST